MLTLSRLRVLELYINTPHWRLAILAHLITSLLSLIVIMAYGVVVAWRVDDTKDGGNILGWNWGNQWLESLAFVPVSQRSLKHCRTHGATSRANLADSR